MLAVAYLTFHLVLEPARVRHPNCSVSLLNKHSTHWQCFSSFPLRNDQGTFSLSVFVKLRATGSKDQPYLGILTYMPVQKAMNHDKNMQT